MARLKYGQLPLAFGAALLLAACQDGMAPGGGTADAGAAAAAQTARSGKPVERDVERPDIFKVTDRGLWDGRPSLGGVWVAHPDVRDPERVLIRNPATGLSVEGALFRREREMPGPLLQVSSDAAEALGLVAGRPTEISVVALRRETIEPEPEPAPAPAPKPKPKDEEAAAVAAAAVKATEAAPAPKAEEAKPAASAAPAAAAAAAETAAEAVTPEPQPKRKWWQRKPKPAEQETASDVSPVTTATIEAAPLDGDGTKVETPAPAPSPAGIAAGGNLSLPYIQIGAFGTESNAKDAAAKISNAGLAVEVKSGTSGGKPVWRVIVGPAVDVSARNEILKKVTELGYKDAYPVKG
ncbi:SPOR domain-containing protein [Ostreiculturibacter nitratireducens]|uniref:SPOR domain-containing protein n=1 Tax=Ostreiculturibacter nitratireducens TaxID=3075226 RepID=UPI0031B570A7